MDAEWAKAVADLDGALTEDAVTSALRDMHRLLSLNPELRATVTKENVIQLAVKKRSASGELWTPDAASAFGELLSVFAQPVFPKQAYPGQPMPPPYLFTPPVAPPADVPPAYTPSVAGGAAMAGAAGALPVATVAVPAPPAYDGGAGGAGGAGDASHPPQFSMPPAPSLFYAPAPDVEVHSRERQIQLGVPVYESPPQEEYTLDFPDGVETTTGALPCRPENLWRVAHINLWHNDVSRIEGLDKYPNLMRLTLRSNDLKTLRGVEQAPNLRWLDASDNDCVVLEGMSNMNSLEWLNLANNDLPNLAGLAWCPRLTWLNLWNNDLRSIDGIETLPSLRTVDLSSNDLTSVRGLAHCKALEEVNLADNDLSDLPSVLALASCPRLRTLNLTGHKFSKDQVRKIREQFAKHLPGCNVILGEGGGGGKCAIM